MTLGIRPPRRPTRIKLTVEPYDIGALMPLRRAPAPASASASASAAPETPRVRVNADPLIPRHIDSE